MHNFACAPHIPIGSHLEFFEEGDEVTCTWTPTENFQSWISTLHGGEICSTAEATFFCFSKEKSINDFHFQPFEVEE